MRKRTVFISFLPLVHNHVQVIWVHTHPVCDVCVCVCVWRVCVCVCDVCVCDVCVHALTEGMSEAWCWRAVIVTTTNHILLWCCMNGIGYLHEVIWLADASVGAWKVASAPRFRHALRQALTPTSQSARTHTSHTHTHVTHRMCVCTQITWTWLCTRGKNDINTVRFLTQTARFVS